MQLAYNKTLGYYGNDFLVPVESFLCFTSTRYMPYMQTRFICKPFQSPNQPTNDQPRLSEQKFEEGFAFLYSEVCRAIYCRYLKVTVFTDTEVPSEVRPRPVSLFVYPPEGRPGDF